MNPINWYKQQITVEHVDTTQLGARGNPVYLAKVTVSAKVNAQQRFVPGKGEEKVLSQYRIATKEPIRPQDRIWVPGADTNKDEASRQALQIQAPTDKAGNVVQYIVDV